MLSTSLAAHRARALALALTLTALAAALPQARAQSLAETLRRAAEEALRKKAQQVTEPAQTQAPAPALPAASAPAGASPVPRAPAAVAAPAPPTATRPAPAAPAGLELRVADGPRRIDLRNGTPPELQWRYLPPNGLVEVANPYVPVDRRFIDSLGAMACHPQGGLVVVASTRRWEPSPQRGEGRDYVDNGSGVWRVEADGRVRPLWVPLGRQTDDGFANCGVPAAQARMPDASSGLQIAVEPGGGVVLASRGARTIVRLRPDGMVEHVAGGGDAFCSTNPTRRRPGTGQRDGPGRQALFSGELSLAVNPRDGTLWVAENDHIDGRSPPNCALRRIDPATGIVSTVRGGRCPDAETERSTGFRSVGYERLTLDAEGRPLLMGVSRARREGVGPAELVYTKVHRVDGEREELLLRAGHGARFEPQGRLVAIGLGPDGAPLAFNTASYSDAGLVTMSPIPPLRYAWRSAPGDLDQAIDGPRGQARIADARSFCTGSDGIVYVQTPKSVRRIHPTTGAVDTWLH
jgi:hypothetical protein